jgi:hypothetical protein
MRSQGAEGEQETHAQSEESVIIVATHCGYFIVVIDNTNKEQVLKCGKHNRAAG